MGEWEGVTYGTKIRTTSGLGEAHVIANGVVKPLGVCPSSDSTVPMSILCASAAWERVTDDNMERSAVDVILVPANDLWEPSPMIELPSSKLASAADINTQQYLWTIFENVAKLGGGWRIYTRHTLITEIMNEGILAVEYHYLIYLNVCYLDDR